jgi:hypothetical protein
VFFQNLQVAMSEKQSKSPVVHVLLPSKLVAINWFDCAVGWLTTTVTLDADADDWTGGAP